MIKTYLCLFINLSMIKQGENIIDRIETLLINRKARPKLEKGRPVTSYNQRYAEGSFENQESQAAAIQRLSSNVISEMHHKQQKDKAKKQEIAAQRQFQVENPVSDYYNRLSPKKPLYERAADLIKEKEWRLELLRIKRQVQIKLKQEQQRAKQQEISQTISRKLPRKQVEKLSDQLYRQGMNRLGRIQTQRYLCLKEYSKNYKQKPEINKQTVQIFQQMSKNRKLSPNVFTRFQQYNAQSQQQKQQLISKYDKLICPFTPKISQNAKKKEKSSDHRCTSCKVLKKGQQTPQKSKHQAHQKSINRSTDVDKR